MPAKKQMKVRPAPPSKKPAGKPGRTQALIAAHLDISQPRVAQFVGDGTFKTMRGGKLDLDACRLAYIRWLRDETRRSTQSEAARRVQEARAIEIEQRTAREDGKLIDVEDLAAWMAETLAMFRSELWGLPAASTRDLAVRAELQKHLDHALGRIEQNFADAAAKCNQGRPAVLTDEVD